MSYHNHNKSIIDSGAKKTVAIATYEEGAAIIVKALNYYFGDTYTRNQTVEMMHSNTAIALNRIADFAKKNEFTAQELIEYLIETAEEIEAQAMVVSLRDELKFAKPKAD